MWYFQGEKLSFLAILTPFQSSDPSEIEILVLWAIKLRYKQLLSNFLIRALETPQTGILKVQNGRQGSKNGQHFPKL